MKQAFKCFTAMVVGIFASIAMYAQVTTASFSGSVKDEAGPLPGAAVIAVHTPSGTQYTAISDKNGNFRFNGITPGGPYTITVEMLGYRTSETVGLYAPVGENTVVDFKMEVDNVSGGFTVDAGVNWFDPNSPSIIWASRDQDNNDDMERAFYPGGFQGNGLIGASQNLVDAFGMADGYPVGQSPTYTYDPQQPYLNRDPRFYSVIFYNGREITTGTSGRTYTFENWSNGGKDAAGVSQKNSLTNYHIKKFVYSGLNWSESSVSKMPHCKFFIRWAHMVLAFAEAANQLGGPNTPIDGLTAKEAISFLRSRDTYDGAEGIVVDPYLDEISISGKDAFNEFLKNERRIETCFEGTWFFDLRRWSTNLEDLNKAVKGVSVERLNSGEYSYDFDNIVETRLFTSAYLPIPYKEMLNVKGLVQNEGWESWQ